ncbi:MAG: hypothetical protein M2R45_04747 [Verrucomicrobia subdivision 3 bacterium]|nr:hypothetical protein [Limisphaerales bacterium]
MRHPVFPAAPALLPTAQEAAAKKRAAVAAVKRFGDSFRYFFPELTPEQVAT